MTKIADDLLAKLVAQLAIRDSAAMALGQAHVEFELARARMVAEGTISNLTYGALHVELDGHRERCMKIYARSMKEQGVIGNAALRAAGVDLDASTVTIDLATGVVMRLEGDKWVEA